VALELCEPPLGEPAFPASSRATGNAPTPEFPATLGIAPATEGPLTVLQFTPPGFGSANGPLGGIVVKDNVVHSRVSAAAETIAFGDLDASLKHLGYGLAQLLVRIVDSAPPGPERSTAISRAREAAMWARAAARVGSE
jgi:hypothetical protein